MWKINNVSHMKEGVGIPSSSVLELVKKLHSHGSFLGRKYTTSQNVVLTEEEHDRIPVKHRFLPKRHGEQLKIYVHCRIKLGSSGTLKNFDYKRRYFCNWSLWAVYDGSLLLTKLVSM
jgi:hypothetical protein